MPVTVLIPTPLRKLTGDADTITVAPGTIADVVRQMDEQHPGVAARLLGDDGSVRKFINVYVNDEDIRFLEGMNTPVADGNSVSIVPAIAGGAG